ncbi:MAG: hypothetical protein AAFU41_06610, partial [Pseudomonadota bacterium]
MFVPAPHKPGPGNFWPNMQNRQIDHFLHQTQIAGHISGRNVPKRLASALMMLGVCMLAGFGIEALTTTAVLVLIEIAAYPLNQRASRFDERISLPIAVAVFGINWAGITPFLAYAVILSNSDPLPFVLAGYLWVFGIYLHVSNTFGLLPLYNWSQMGVA